MITVSQVHFCFGFIWSMMYIATLTAPRSFLFLGPQYYEWVCSTEKGCNFEVTNKGRMDANASIINLT